MPFVDLDYLYEKDRIYIDIRDLDSVCSMLSDKFDVLLDYNTIKVIKNVCQNIQLTIEDAALKTNVLRVKDKQLKKIIEKTLGKKVISIKQKQFLSSVSHNLAQTTLDDFLTEEEDPEETEGPEDIETFEEESEAENQEDQSKENKDV